jgi:hypothetical protein
MAAYALLIGTKGESRELLADGDPREVRRLFKETDTKGYDLLEVIDTREGRTRRKRTKSKPPAKKAAKKAAKETE